MAGISRETLKWIQSLDLTWQIKNPKWDLSNGYLIAEIFSWYFPQHIQMHSFYNRDSLELKERNWYILKNFIQKNNLALAAGDIDGTIHCREGAAAQLVQKMYEILTNRKIKKLGGQDVDYTDSAYQERLPLHARSTASKAVKNNLRLTEVIADQNMISAAQKSQRIINEHIEHRRQQRAEDPKRFGIKSTLGDRCLRRPEPPQTLHESSTMSREVSTDVPAELGGESERPLTREASVTFKEVEVKQMDKSAFYSLPIQSY